MIDNALFFVYILASFAGLLSVIMAALLIRYWSNGNRKMLGALLGFEVCTVVIAIMYFVYYFMNISEDTYHSNPLIRVLDVWMYIGQAVMWAVYAREKSRITVIKSRRLKAVIVAALLIASAILYGVIMEGYYYVGRCVIPAVIVEITVDVVAVCIIMIYTYKALQQIVLKKIRFLMISIALITMLNSLWNLVLSLALMDGRDLVTDMPNADLTPVMLLLISVLILILLTSEDFSSLFAKTEAPASMAETASEKSPLDTEMKLNIIAVEHMLTEREREVLVCAYNGLTNPQIAAQLNISQSTVKRHMHNVFEKIDVESRIELIHMVNGWVDNR